MNRLASIGATLLSSGLKVRTLMLVSYVALFVGFLMGLGWALAVKFATDAAVGLIEWVQS